MMPTVTFFDDVRAQVARPVQMTEADLAELVANPDETPSKETCPLIKLGRFGDKRTDKGSLRSDENLIGVTGAEGDYDGEQMPMQTAAAMCEQAGIRALFYTSASHTPEAPRWRVLVPFSKEYPPNQRNRFLARLNGILGGILGGESFTLSQSFYIGQVNGAVYEHANVDGDYIDLRDDLDARAISPEQPIKGNPKNSAGSDAKKIQRLIHEVMTGENYHHALIRIAASYAKRGIPRDDIIVFLEGMMLSHRIDSNSDRWQARYGDIPRAVDSAIEKFAPEAAADMAASMTPVCADDLLDAYFEPLHWNIADILPAGTLLLFGKPKKGKSFLVLLLCISIAARRPVFGKGTSGATVLYLGLEDSERRAQRRIKGCAKVLGLDRAEFAKRLYISTTSKRIDNGLIDDLREWMTAHPEAGVIVIDMLKKVTGASTGKKTLYEEQAEVGHALTTLSHEYPQLSIVVVHHSRKTESDDPFDLVSGTTGLSGSYDSLAAIADTDGERVLHITGRDIEGAEIPLLMNDAGMYTLEMPDPDEVAAATMSTTRRRVYDAVPVGEAYQRKDIASGCGLSDSIVAKQLSRLKRDGLVKKADYGKYQKTGKHWFDEPIKDFK